MAGLLEGWTPLDTAGFEAELGLTPGTTDAARRTRWRTRDAQAADGGRAEYLCRSSAADDASPHLERTASDDGLAERRHGRASASAAARRRGASDRVGIRARRERKARERWAGQVMSRVLLKWMERRSVWAAKRTIYACWRRRQVNTNIERRKSACRYERTGDT